MNICLWKAGHILVYTRSGEHRSCQHVDPLSTRRDQGRIGRHRAQTLIGLIDGGTNLSSTQ